MQRQVFVNFQTGDGFEDISHLVKYDTLEVTLRAASSNYHYAQNSATFSVIYDSVYYPKFRYSTEEILVRILDIFDDSILSAENFSLLTTEDGYFLGGETGGSISPFFYGRIPPTKSRSYNGILDNTFMSLEALDELTLLDKKIGDVAYKSYKICDPANKATSILHQLCYRAGLIDAQISANVTIDVSIAVFVPPSEEDSILKILDTLLYEYGYVLNMNTAGEIEPLRWMVFGATSFTFNDTNIQLQADITDSIREYNGADVTYHEVAQLASTLPLGRLPIYTDSTIPRTDKGEFPGYPVLAGTKYPPKTNSTDPVTGQPYVVYQDYDDSNLRYWTNEAIVNKLDYNYKAFDSDYSDLLLTENHLLDWRGDTGIVLATEEYQNRKARIVFSNPTGAPLNLYYLRILATAWYKKSERKATVLNAPDATELDSYVAQFIQTEDYATTLATYMAAQHDRNLTEYSFASEEEVAVGSYVRVLLGDGTDQNCLVMSRKWDEVAERYDYELKGYSLDLGTLDSQEYRESPAVIMVPQIVSNLSASDMAVQAKLDGTAPTLTGAATRMVVKTDGADDSMGWSYSVALSGITGAMGAGSDKNLFTATGFTDAATLVGTATITATRAGYSDQVAVFTLRKSIPSDGVSAVAELSPKYLGRYAALPGSANTNDTALKYANDSTQGIYQWNGTIWVDVPNPSNDTIARAWIDITWALNNSYGVLVDYVGTGTNYLEVLGANVAFINELFAQYIKVNDGGTIRGGDRFNASGTVIDMDKSGFFLSSDGTFKTQVAGATGANVNIDPSGNQIFSVYTGADPAFRVYRGTSGDFGDGDVVIGKLTGPNDDTNQGLMYDASTGAVIARLNNLEINSEAVLNNLSALSYSIDTVAMVPHRHYKMNSTTLTNDGNDGSGTGTLYGGTLVAGKISNAISLDSATSDYMEYPTFATPVSTKLDIAFWASIANATDRVFIGQWQSGGAGTDAWLLAINYAGSNTITFFHVDSGGTPRSNVASYTWPINTFFHVRYIFENGNIKVYVDGTAVKVGDTGGVDIRTTALPLWVGRYNSVYGKFKIDDLRIYRGLFSDIYSEDLYNSGTGTEATSFDHDRYTLFPDTQIKGYLENTRTINGMIEVAGAIRQGAGPGYAWTFISDSEHTPINVVNVYGSDDGAGTVYVTIYYNFTATKVVTFVATPDESYAQAGIQMGASVGTTYATLRFSKNGTALSSAGLYSYGGAYANIWFYGKFMVGE